MVGEKKHGSDIRHGAFESKTKEITKNDVKENEIIENIITVNTKGNEAVAGQQSKPKHVDLDRPMMFYKHHILICEGKRCAKAGSKSLAHDLRTILKVLGLSSGEQRIKISRTLCAGACRNFSTMVIYEQNGKPFSSEHQPLSENNALWLRGIEAFSEQQWKALFNALANNKPLFEVVEHKYFAPIEGLGETNL